jgi:hypothetical protein
MARLPEILSDQFHFCCERIYLGWPPLFQGGPQHLQIKIDIIVRFLTFKPQHAHDEAGDLPVIELVVGQGGRRIAEETDEEVGWTGTQNGTEIAVPEQERREQMVEQAASRRAS